MRKITARRLRPGDRADVRLPNEPFPLWGTMTVTYDGSAWAWPFTGGIGSGTCIWTT